MLSRRKEQVRQGFEANGRRVFEGSGHVRIDMLEMYALGGLTPGEYRHVSGHLQYCQGENSCQSKVDNFIATSRNRDSKSLQQPVGDRD